MTSTKDVLDHHLKCFGEGDLEGILSDYAPVFYWKMWDMTPIKEMIDAQYEVLVEHIMPLTK